VRVSVGGDRACYRLSSVDQPTVTLRSGAEMPVLGLGVWQMSAGSETEQAVEWALEAGYRSIDTAAMYRNEQSVGAALRRSGVAREDVFVATKLPPPHPDASRQLAKSLERLGLGYVDLYLIHWPLPVGNTRVWHELEDLQARGLARDVGVSNFGADRLEKLAGRARQVPAVNQIQFSPFQYRKALLDYCHTHEIVFEAYSPLAQGRMSDPTIAEVAERAGRTPAQVLLRWAVQHGTVVIPKSSRRDRIVANANIFDFELDEGDMVRLDALDRTGRTSSAR
jgi:diketogulonate reductase-like aldo/keto reductase